MTAGARALLWRRAAAAVALLSLPAAAVIILAAVAERPGEVIGGVLLLLLTVAAVWDAALATGAVRAIALIVAAAALAGAVVLLLDNPLRLIAGVVLVVLATALARVALGRDMRALRATPIPGRRVPSAGHPVLLMNPRSGGGKVERFGLAHEADRRGIEPVLLRPGDDLRALAADAVERGADVIGMAGGDGSQALVADVARRHGVGYVCVPAGTRNHLALDLGLDRDDVVGALDAFGEAVERRIDLARVGDRVFVSNTSLGVYAEAVRSEGYRDAKIATLARTLPELMGAGGLELRFAGPDGVARDRADVILISNNPYRLAQLDGFGTRRSLDSGRLGVVAIQVDGPGAAAELVAPQSVGRQRLFRGWHEWECDQFSVVAPAPIALGVDGESLVMGDAVRFASLPGALRVRIPLHAPGRSPAARAVHPLREVPALVRMVFGRTGGAEAA